MTAERRFETGDIDVAVDALGHAFPGSRLWLDQIEPRFTFRLSARRGDRLQRTEQHLAARLSASGAPAGDAVMVWSTSGAARYGPDRSPADGALLWSGTGDPLAATVEHAELRSVSIPAAHLADHATRITGRDWSLPSRLTPAPRDSLTVQRRTAFDAAVTLALHDVVQDNALLRARALDTVVALGLALFGLDSAAPQSSACPRTVRRAIAYIDEHHAEPITVADVAAATGLSTRGLEAVFRRHLDRTPAQHLRRVRLDAAHRDLQQADPSTTAVATVALRHGFRHLGRFAGAYRDAYGVLPSAALGR